MMDDDSRMTIMYHYIYTLSWYFQSLAPSLVNGFDTFWTNTGYLLFITNKAHTSWLDVTGFFHASFDQREHATFSRNAVSFFFKSLHQNMLSNYDQLLQSSSVATKSCWKPPANQIIPSDSTLVNPTCRITGSESSLANSSCAMATAICASKRRRV